MATAFKHDFAKTGTAARTHEMNGYLQALKEVYIYIEATTAMKPENRYIDSSQMLDKITATCDELRPLYAEEIKSILQSLSNPLT